jgi:hypothetical protein
MLNYFEGSEKTAKVWLRFRQEILLSYRILFGQDRASRALFHNKVKKQAQEGSALPHEPLLDILCGEPTSSSKIRALPASLWPKSSRNADNQLQQFDEYSISSDLPLLGARFLAIQEFNLRQRPRSFWGFWRDTRDRQKWYTVWIVLIVGILAIILAIVQVVLSAAQLAVSVKPGLSR